MHRPSNFVRSTHSQDGGTILDLRTGRLFWLNSTASLIWDQLRKGQPEAQIAQTVADCFGISEEVARNDVAHFLESVGQHELLLPMTSD